jgi:hypothetical protein
MGALIGTLENSQTHKDTLNPWSHVLNWKHIDSDELYVFLAIKMLMGINQCQQWCYILVNIFFLAHQFFINMSQEWNKLFSRFLHFVKNNKIGTFEGSTKLFKTDLKHLNCIFSSLYSTPYLCGRADSNSSRTIPSRLLSSEQNSSLCPSFTGFCGNLLYTV